ncbi:MAG: 3-hydroxyacyl-CoA dehydrogenase NAD-binding domain-containing protein [Ilumatobacteraceae bacterium]|nr:3-hydroxyacyl-CoA dehydrogenase NAD-binding domain-containing protein [Ilumatobacteraceae bacterium]
MAEAPVERAAAIGCGVIGAGWIARLRLNGVDVDAFDPSPDATRIIATVHDNALLSWRELDLEPASDAIGSLTMHDSIDRAVASAELIVESVPERLDLKHATLAAIDHAAPVGSVIASSTSGFRPSRLAEPLAHPERLVVGHPFNPVYLLPLVEVVGGRLTDPSVIERAMSTYRSLGMHPLHVRSEIDAHIADRLLEAVWREALWLVNDGIATTEEIDDAIRYGFGLRWAQMGLFETYRIAGGEGGMRHFISQFGECLSWPWTKLMDVPELTDELIDTIATQSDEQSGHHDIRDLERIRDRNVAAMLLALERNGWGAGQTIAAMRESTGQGAAQVVEP